MENVSVIISSIQHLSRLFLPQGFFYDMHLFMGHGSMLLSTIKLMKNYKGASSDAFYQIIGLQNHSIHQ